MESDVVPIASRAAIVDLSISTPTSATTHLNAEMLAQVLSFTPFLIGILVVNILALVLLFGIALWWCLGKLDLKCLRWCFGRSEMDDEKEEMSWKELTDGKAIRSLEEGPASPSASRMTSARGTMPVPFEKSDAFMRPGPGLARERYHPVPLLSRSNASSPEKRRTIASYSSITLITSPSPYTDMKRQSSHALPTTQLRESYSLVDIPLTSQGEGGTNNGRASIVSKRSSRSLPTLPPSTPPRRSSGLPTDPVNSTAQGSRNDTPGSPDSLRGSELRRSGLPRAYHPQHAPAKSSPLKPMVLVDEQENDNRGSKRLSRGRYSIASATLFAPERSPAIPNLSKSFGASDSP